MSHTPTPWQLATNDPTLILSEAVDADGDAVIIADVLNGTINGVGLDTANAAFIIKAVNAHDELVEACRLAYEDWQNGEHGSPAFIALERALAKAGVLS